MKKEARITVVASLAVMALGLVPGILRTSTARAETPTVVSTAPDALRTAPEAEASLANAKVDDRLHHVLLGLLDQERRSHGRRR